MGAPTLQIVTPIKAFSARSRFPFPRSLHRAGTGTGIPSKSLLTVPSKSVVMLTSAMAQPPCPSRWTSRT